MLSTSFISGSILDNLAFAPENVRIVARSDIWRALVSVVHSKFTLLVFHHPMFLHLLLSHMFRSVFYTVTGLGALWLSSFLICLKICMRGSLSRKWSWWLTVLYGSYTRADSATVSFSIILLAVVNVCNSFRHIAERFFGRKKMSG